MRTPIAAALAGLILAAQAVAGTPTPEDRVIAAAAALQRHTGDFGALDGKPGDLDAWNGLWTAVQAYVANRLDHGVTANEIEKQAPALNSIYGGLTIVAIGQDLYAASANAGPLGNVFLVGKRSGRFTTVWDIRQSAMGNTAWGWNGEAARDKCRRCRPASGTVTALPPDARGRARFYIDAGYAQEMGATSGAQLSIWAFDGRKADVLLQKNYVVVADDENAPTDQGPLIRRHNKRDYRMLFACGSCLGRMMTWTVKVSPGGVTDLGETADIPEADAVDEVFFRLWHGKPVRGFADPAVIAQMTAIVANAKTRWTDPALTSIGMVMDVSRTRQGARTILVFSTDNDMAPVMRFVLVGTKSGLFLEKLKISQQKQ